ncbi:hypothetical protein ACIBFB_08070 [Nocardiopsis sp. NPDC050513]|uniref:aromatic-ring hydroxylase C-terminal domain-containing protein n=1 Tax=Nocardiopsis sp. NPDC050513 TaxID=3364338 RepID=UPI0037B21276
MRGAFPSTALRDRASSRAAASRRREPATSFPRWAIRVYEPSTRPGSPMPHAWLDTFEGERLAAMDLVAPGRFLLVSGEDGQDWVEAARELCGRGSARVDAVRIGHTDGDDLDPRLTWTRLRGHGPGGAVLIRPDRFVAWRHREAAADPAQELASAFHAVLGR